MARLRKGASSPLADPPLFITGANARKNLFRLIQQVNDDRAPFEITSKNGRAVLISADE